VREGGEGGDLLDSGVVEEEKKEGGQGRKDILIYSIGKEVRVNTIKDSLRIYSYCGCQWQVHT
jgi:hypothetical protein